MNLFEQFPRPWTIVENAEVDPKKCVGGFHVYDAKGVLVLEGGTWTGCGNDTIFLNRLQAAELVSVVNASNL